MKMGWTTKTLGQACVIKPPKSEARARVAGHELVSFLPMEDLGIDRKFGRGFAEKPVSAVSESYTYFADGDVLLAKITPCFENGKLGIAKDLANGIGFGSSEYIVFRPGANLDKEWLYYFLSRESFREEGEARMAGAVGHKRVAKEFVENYPIPIPPLPEQKGIVAILDEAFAGIANAKANAEKNLQNARAIFESKLQSIFTQRDREWAMKKLGDICDFEGGSQPPKSNFVYEPKKGYLRFLQIRDFGSDKYVTFIPMSKKNRQCVDTDIMIGRYGASVGKILSGKAGAYNVALMKAIPDLAQLERDFVYYYLTSGAFQEPLKKVAARSAQNGFSKEDIYGFAVPVPSISEQRKVIQQIGPLADETKHLASIYERKLVALDALRKSLLHRAFAGELTASKAAGLIEAVA